MALETGTYISDLTATNPTATDPKSEGDDHLRLIKSTIKATFPNTSFPVNPVVQIQYSQDGALATGTTTIPLDDTIPQNTEGDQYMSLAITPKATTNILVIDVIAYLSLSAAGNLILALFQDATANSLAAVAQSFTTGGEKGALTLRHVMAAGTTSATTFYVRAGMSGAGTTTFNGAASARQLGGVAASSIVITEICS